MVESSPHASHGHIQLEVDIPGPYRKACGCVGTIHDIFGWAGEAPPVAIDKGRIALVSGRWFRFPALEWVEHGLVVSSDDDAGPLASLAMILRGSVSVRVGIYVSRERRPQATNNSLAPEVAFSTTSDQDGAGTGPSRRHFKRQHHSPGFWYQGSCQSIGASDEPAIRGGSGSC